MGPKGFVDPDKGLPELVEASNKPRLTWTEIMSALDRVRENVSKNDPENKPSPTPPSVEAVAPRP